MAPINYGGFKGKDREWFKNNVQYMSSWENLKRMFKERYFGLYDEDDMLDDLRIRVQRKNESILDFVDAFIYLVSRLRHPPPVHTQVGIAFKNVLLEYRSHMLSRTPKSFKELLDLGREYEKEKKLDERYSQLTGKKWDKLAAIEEKPVNKENKGNGSEHPANRGEKKKGINETDSVTGELEQVAAIQEKQPDSRRPMGQAWSNTGPPQQQAPWRPRPRVDSAPPLQPHYPAVISQSSAGLQPAQKDN